MTNSSRPTPVARRRALQLALSAGLVTSLGLGGLLTSPLAAQAQPAASTARLAITLVDALYEKKVKLICSAEAAPEKLYTEGDGTFEFERTVSRLMEMQSPEYLALEHIA